MSDLNMTMQEQLIQDFKNIVSWEDRYKRIIEMGRELAPFPEFLKTDDLKVKGCQSQVWLHARLDDRQRIQFQADSDALIVKGLIAVLLRIYSNRTPQEILDTEPDFIRELGLESHLSPSRANGLYAMVKQIKYYALAYLALAKK